MFTGSLSTIGSVIIIYIILHSHVRLTTVYHCIMLGCAISDIFQSVYNSLLSLPAPKDSGVLYANGNQTTCNIQAFIWSMHYTSEANLLGYEFPKEMILAELCKMFLGKVMIEMGLRFVEYELLLIYKPFCWKIF